MKSLIKLIFLLFAITSCFAQEGFDVSFEGRALASTGADNPFWFYANQKG